MFYFGRRFPELPVAYMQCLSDSVVMFYFLRHQQTSPHIYRVAAICEKLSAPLATTQSWGATRHLVKHLSEHKDRIEIVKSGTSFSLGQVYTSF